MIILDSDLAIDILRRHPPAIAWARSTTAPVCLPGVVALELYNGCHNKAQMLTLQGQIARFAILWPSPAESNAALANFAMAHLSHSLGLLDSLIAATALSYQVPLHTFNQKHFAAIPALQTLQPYTR